ncbi:sigma-54-dependent transcriptional regulator [Methylotuvimicrobium sp. KM1]|uniref:sigma-54-dependent transcriptional regulator n=1 Tax=Methylotuvimicrobium sp. KM1 TaxID=3377707 RepID=UPI00384D9D8B
MKQYDVLIVEDDPDLCEALSDTLELEGYRVLAAHNGTEALAKLGRNRVKLVVSDVQMPVMDGFELLRNIHALHPGLPVLLMTAYGTVPKAVRAMQEGAVDYLVKPFEASALIDKVAAFAVADAPAADFTIGQDPAMQKLYRLIERVAQTHVTVLLQGESGTGKEVVARAIHEQSPYRGGSFAAVNCAAIPDNMLEAMLFGYEKGAFTGAVQSMPGKFELAQDGTLLLDEIAEMDLGLQAKLLRVLQEKEVERIGSHRKIELNVRILAATNRKLKQSVEQGLFREDLYYRLSVFPLRIPALRERPGDIVPLAIELLRRHGFDAACEAVFDREAIDKMQAYSWPGNVRELENVMQRALILKSSKRIVVEDLIFEENVDLHAMSETVIENACVDSSEDTSSLGDQVRSAEEKMILQTLLTENGSRKTTAEKLGISPRTLRYKIARMKESGIAIPCSA